MADVVRGIGQRCCGSAVRIGFRKAVPDSEPAQTQGGATILILSRKPGEKIIIGDSIVLTVVEIDRGRVRIGIQAPRDVPVMRAELIPTPYPIPPDLGGES